MSASLKRGYAADMLRAQMMKEKNKKRREQMRKAWLRALARIRNRVDELHKKLSTWLCRNHRVVLIPKFAVKRMTARQGGKRRLHRKTSRGMYTWGHFRFFQRLIAKSKLFSLCTVIPCDEAYTSKTCGKCGTINPKLRSQKIFKCSTCGYKADRDISAARSILLRYLTLEKIDFF